MMTNEQNQANITETESILIGSSPLKEEPQQMLSYQNVDISGTELTKITTTQAPIAPTPAATTSVATTSVETTITPALAPKTASFSPKPPAQPPTAPKIKTKVTSIEKALQFVDPPTRTREHRAIQPAVALEKEQESVPEALDDQDSESKEEEDDRDEGDEDYTEVPKESVLPSSKLLNRQPRGRIKRYDKSTLLLAIDKVGRGMRIRRAALMYGIPTTTLHEHVNGLRKETVGRAPLLGKQVELSIAKGVRHLADLGHLMNKGDILELTGRYLKELKKESCFKQGKPTDDWYYGFMKRNKSTLGHIQKPRRNQPIAENSNILEKLQIFQSFMSGFKALSQNLKDGLEQSRKQAPLAPAPGKSDNDYTPNPSRRLRERHQQQLKQMQIQQNDDLDDDEYFDVASSSKQQQEPQHGNIPTSNINIGRRKTVQNLLSSGSVPHNNNHYNNNNNNIDNSNSNNNNHSSAMNNIARNATAMERHRQLKKQKIRIDDMFKVFESNIMFACGNLKQSLVSLMRSENVLPETGDDDEDNEYLTYPSTFSKGADAHMKEEDQQQHISNNSNNNSSISMFPQVSVRTGAAKRKFRFDGSGSASVNNQTKRSNLIATCYPEQSYTNNNNNNINGFKRPVTSKDSSEKDDPNYMPSDAASVSSDSSNNGKLNNFSINNNNFSNFNNDNNNKTNSDNAINNNQEQNMSQQYDADGTGEFDDMELLSETYQTTTN